MSAVYFAPMPLLESFLLLLALAGGWFWIDSLRAREAGITAVRDACQADGLQLLDETVAGESLRWARDDAGRLRFRRVFVFEYSDTGNNRRRGRITLLGQDVEFLHLRPQLYIVPKAPDETLH